MNTAQKERLSYLIFSSPVNLRCIINDYGYSEFIIFGSLITNAFSWSITRKDGSVIFSPGICDEIEEYYDSDELARENLARFLKVEKEYTALRTRRL